MEEEMDTSIRFHECTATGFRECTEPSVCFHECTETGFQECTERLSISRSALKPVSKSALNRLSVSRSALKWVSATGKQHRHAAPRQRVTFTLPPHHVDKDSMLWQRIQPEECTTYRIVPRTVELHSPPITLLQPHPSQGILATSTAGAACSVYYLYGAAQAVALAARAAATSLVLALVDTWTIHKNNNI